MPRSVLSTRAQALHLLSLPLSFVLAACTLYDGQLSGDDGVDTDLGTGSSGSSSSSSGGGGDSGICQGTCSLLGVAECRDGGVVVCADPDGDGCLQWSEPSACGAGEACEDGECVFQTASHFDASTAWSIPPGGHTSQGFVAAGGTPAALGDDFWMVRDIDGDGRLDLVVTARAVSKQGYEWFPRSMGYPSKPYWEVHFGTDAGFEATPKAWPVPAGGLVDHGIITAEGVPAAVGDNAWSLLDMDGDHRPDLVMTGRALANNGSWTVRAFGYPAAPFWEVYRNLGDGFDPVPDAWFLPLGGPPDRGFMAASNTASSVGDLSWVTRDLDGDGWLDIAVTGKGIAAPDESVVPRVLGSLQNPYWDVYFGASGSFAEAPKAWMVPTGGGVVSGFAATAGVPKAVDDQRWELLDLDGDRRDDLVMTATATAIDGDAWVGEVPGMGASPHWLVYTNRGNGFSRDPVQWRVPDGGRMQQGFVEVRGQARSFGDVFWDTLDLDGDGALELVVTGSWTGDQPPECKGQVLGFAKGEPRWDVHPATTEGFIGAPWAFFVPESGLASCGLRETAGAAGALGDASWYTGDLDGDGFVDLVVTGVADGDPWTEKVPGYGEAPHWQLFRGVP